MPYETLPNGSKLYTYLDEAEEAEFWARRRKMTPVVIPPRILKHGGSCTVTVGPPPAAPSAPEEGE